MKHVMYTPEVVKSGEYEGQVVLSKPTFDEKYEYMEKMGEGGVYNRVEGEDADPIEEIKFARKLVSASEKHYKKVELKRKSDGEIFKSFDDLAVDDDCDRILIDIAKFIILPKGGNPEKKRKSKRK